MKPLLLLITLCTLIAALLGASFGAKQTYAAGRQDGYNQGHQDALLVNQQAAELPLKRNATACDLARSLTASPLCSKQGVR